MPRFPVNFRRKSTVTDDQNGPVEPSFRVLERNDMTAGRSFDGGARMVKAAVGTPRTTLQEIAMDDNLFVDTKNNRYVAQQFYSLLYCPQKSPYTVLNQGLTGS